MLWVSRVLASGLGVGRLPYAPGTWATLVAVMLASGLSTLALPYFAALSVCAVLLSIPICGAAAHAREEQDPSWIVLDEVVGTWIALACVERTNIWAVLAAACLFRVLDIHKPWPVKWLDEKVSGGLGIVADDVAAGALSGACVAGAAYAYALV